MSGLRPAFVSGGRRAPQGAAVLTRHGEATNIRIAGEVRAGTLNLSVRDDGCGFDVGSRPKQTEGHFGLDGIIERVERLGGTFKIESSPGKGTYALISINRPSAERTAKQAS